MLLVTKCVTLVLTTFLVGLLLHKHQQIQNTTNLMASKRHTPDVEQNVKNSQRLLCCSGGTLALCGI